MLNKNHRKSSIKVNICKLWQSTLHSRRLEQLRESAITSRRIDIESNPVSRFCPGWKLFIIFHCHFFCNLLFYPERSTKTSRMEDQCAKIVLQYGYIMKWKQRPLRSSLRFSTFGIPHRMFFVPLLFCSTQRWWPPALSIVVTVRDTFDPVSVEEVCSASSCRGKSVDQPLNPYLAGVPLVPVAPRVLVHPAGRAQSAMTAGIFDHPDYSNPLTIINSPSRLRSFSTSDPAQMAPSSRPSFQKVVSYLNTKQSSAASNNPLLRDVSPAASESFGRFATETSAIQSNL